MTTITKIILGALSAVVLGTAGFFLVDNLLDSKQKQSDTPEKIVADQEDLLSRVEHMRMFMGDTCDNKKDNNKKIEAMEKELDDLLDRKKEWLNNVPKLPDVDLDDLKTENEGRPGSEVPELTSDVPSLPDIDSEDIKVLGSEVPELSSDVPPLPEVDVQVVDDSGNPVEYVPELPELNTGRPGSEVPDLTPDNYIPELPEIDDLDIVDPDEPIIKMAELEEKIKNILQELKTMCADEEKKKVISDKCSDACQRYKDCASYTEDVTPTDLEDAYNTCMEECPTWTKEIIKCINAVDIKKPNDCVSFVQCQLPQFYGEKYRK
ncbi:MAG TPA: hypothetical protein P5230_02515 [Candidatus Magasanikbacteria bacterium]|nr:hypothetical protein [Candidatus Magasanikbacteria bacterium]